MSHTAGTPGRGYKVVAECVNFRPDRDDYGYRTHCVCGAERAEHDRRLRTLEQPARKSA